MLTGFCSFRAAPTCQTPHGGFSPSQGGLGLREPGHTSVGPPTSWPRWRGTPGPSHCKASLVCPSPHPAAEPALLQGSDGIYHTCMGLFSAGPHPPF